MSTPRQRKIEALENSISRLSDMTLTLAPSLLGFSIVFLGGNKDFDHPWLLKASWIALGFSILAGLSAKMYGFAIASWEVDSLVAYEGYFKVARLIGMFSSFLALGPALWFLLAFGYVNI